MPKTIIYPKKKCPKCKKLISINGVAWSSHMKSHERRAKELKKKRNKKEIFVDLNKFPFAMVGSEAIGGQPSKVWQFPNLDETIPPIQASRYFITTGEAIQKMDKLIEDIRERLKAAHKFRKQLSVNKGASKYLETTREGSTLLCKQKDPRKNRDNVTALSP